MGVYPRSVATRRMSSGASLMKASDMQKRHTKEERRTIARVPVISFSGEDLTPTDVAQARRLVERGAAKPVWKKGVYTIQMVREVGTKKPEHFSV